MKRRIAAVLTVASALFCAVGCRIQSTAGSDLNVDQLPVSSELALELSDQKVLLNGEEIFSDSEGAITVSNDIVYYEAGKGSGYGEGTENDAHTRQEAEAHKVVTIRQPGTYLVSGELTAGQLAIDLGEDAKRNPDAVVTLVLNGVDITCSVAPALIFYRVYECDSQWVAYDEGELEAYDSSSAQNTATAGANIILADGSENNINGSYVARIYKEGTTKKLHKYDGAFYSKMSMNISGQSAGTGVLNIQAQNEGLDSELHLTINGGIINIQAQNDGINTNEDGVSVTTINGGTLQINAGLGVEGDGIDSNGHLVINGGNLYTVAHERTPDGGIDADGDILINGGYVVAVGTRNDAVNGSSAQPLMELSFASTLPAGSQIELLDSESNHLLSFVTAKAAQAVTFSSELLQKDVAYTLKVDGVIQQYTGNSVGGFGGFGGGLRPGKNEFTPPDAPVPPDGFAPPDIPERPNMSDMPVQGDVPPPMDTQRPDNHQMHNRPESPDGNRVQFPSGFMNSQTPGFGGSVKFIITDSIHSFSGIFDSAEESGKTRVTFSAQVRVDDNGTVSITDITASEDVDPSNVQLSLADVPSEDYAASCLWSDGLDGVQSILPEDPGTYQLTISVIEDDTYTGASQFNFMIPGT